MSFKSIGAENIAYLVVGILLFILVAKEAYVCPITHDEVSTIAGSQESVYDIVTYKDPIPNNHLLNTLFLKLSIGLFGDHPFSNRLPNVLFFIPYFIFCVKISKLHFREVWVRYAVVCMLSLQPFLLDFFALTRGYGMSVSLQMISMFYFFERLNTKQTRPFIFCLGFAGLSVMASFTMLNYFIPIVALLGFESIFRNKNSDLSLMFKDIRYLSLMTFILGLFCYLPFTRMMGTNQFSFWGTSGFMQDTIYPLIISIRSGAPYWDWTHDIVAKFILSLVSLVTALGIIFYQKLSVKKYFVYALAILLITVVYNLLQFYILKVPFLNARGSLLFIPMVVVVLGFGMQALVDKNEKIGLILAMFMSVLSLQHFVRSFSVNSNFEWYYDANTYDVLRDLEYMITTENISKPVKVNCHWIFYPSLNYHINQKYRDVIQLVPYHKEIQPDSDAMFYYSQSDELNALSAKFNVVRDYAWGSRYLLKRK